MRSLGPALGAGLLAAAVVLPGLSIRDMGGDELWMLTGGGVEILVKSLHPDQVFTGHLPLSYWARSLALSVFDPRNAGAWRIHAALAAIAAAAVTATIPARQGRPGLGLAAGCLLALSPLLAFHAQDSSNYAATVLLGALVLRGLAGLSAGQGGAFALGAGLALSALNDVYSAVLIAAAALLSLGMTRRRPVGLAWAWAAALSVGLPVAALLASRLLRQDGDVLALHADPVASGTSAWSLVLGRLQRFSGAALGGYGAGRADALWEALPPLLILGLGAAAALRRDRPPWARIAAGLLGLGLGLLVLCGLLVLAGWDRVLPLEARTSIGLLPALCLCLVGAIDRLPRRLRGLASALLLLLLAQATLQQGLSRSRSQADAAALVLREIAPGETVVGDPRVLDRLRLGGLDESRLSPCLQADPPPGRAFWWVRLQPLDQALDLRGCPLPSGDVPMRDLSAFSPTRAWTAGPPAHERGAASFLMPAVVMRYGPAAGPGPQRLSLVLDRAPLDGLGGGTLVMRDLQRPDQPPTYRSLGEDGALDFDFGERSALGAVELRLRPRHRPGLPALSLLDPLRRDVQQWEAVLLPVGPDPTAVHLKAVALQDPGLAILRRLGGAGLSLLLLWAALRRRVGGPP